MMKKLILYKYLIPNYLNICYSNILYIHWLKNFYGYIYKFEKYMCMNDQPCYIHSVGYYKIKVILNCNYTKVIKTIKYLQQKKGN
jgi:hypothetical protein